MFKLQSAARVSVAGLVVRRVQRRMIDRAARLVRGLPAAWSFPWLVSLGGVAAFAASVRWAVCGESFWIDELHTAWCATGRWDQIADRAIIGNQQPAFFAAMWLWNNATEGIFVWLPVEARLRLPIVAASIISVVLLSDAVRRASGSRVAALAVGVGASIEINHVFYGTELRPYAMVDLAVAVMLWLAAGRWRHRRVAMHVAAVVAVLCHVTALPVVGGLLVMDWLAAKIRLLESGSPSPRFESVRDSEPTALAAGSSALNPRLAPSAHSFRMSPSTEPAGRRLQDPSPPDPLSPKRGEGEKELGADRIETAWMPEKHFLTNLWLVALWVTLSWYLLVCVLPSLWRDRTEWTSMGSAASGWELLAVWPLAALLVVPGIVWAWGRDRIDRRIIAWAALSAMVIGGAWTISRFGVPLWHRRYLVGTLPPLWLLAGVLVGKSRWPGTGGVCLIAALIWQQAPYRWPIVRRAENWRAAVNYVNDHAAPGQIVWIDPGLIEQAGRSTPVLDPAAARYFAFAVDGPYRLDPTLIRQSVGGRPPPPSDWLITRRRPLATARGDRHWRWFGNVRVAHDSRTSR